MQWPFDLFDEIGNVVQIESRPKASEVTGLDRERLTRRRGRRPGPAPSQRIVDHIAEGPPRPARQGLELGGDVIIQGQRGAHTLMLMARHHDVNGPRR